MLIQPLASSPASIYLCSGHRPSVLWGRGPKGRPKCMLWWQAEDGKNGCQQNVILLHSWQRRLPQLGPLLTNMLRLLRARKTLKQRERRGTSRAIYNSWKIPYRESLCHPNPDGRRPPGQASFSSAGRPDTSEGIAQPMWDRWPMQVQMGQWSPLSTLVHIRMRVVAEDPNLEPEEQGIASPPDSVYPDA